jgi:hypothetical protein
MPQQRAPQIGVGELAPMAETDLARQSDHLVSIMDVWIPVGDREQVERNHILESGGDERQTGAVAG